jgi:hypothetical protein
MVRPRIRPPKTIPILDDHVFCSQEVFFWLKRRVVVRVTTPFDQIYQLSFLVFPMVSNSFNFDAKRTVSDVYSRSWRLIALSSSKTFGTAVVCLQIFNIDDRVYFEVGRKVKLV